MQIGRYEVIRELKGGGMGSVTLCQSPDGSLVVLKRPHSLDLDAAVRLRDEARLGARLLHPAIVDTLDFFEDGSTPVLVVAYVDGLSLENLRGQGPLPPGAVARIGRQIAEALDALHLARDEAGRPLNILHRDVTPGNIVVDRWGDAKLIDLGIARFADRQAEHTQVGFLRGTMRYLAPELIHGASYSTASDLWSLGLVLWEAALGRHAYRTDGDREVLASILRGQPMELSPSERIDDTLRDAIAPLLDPDPERRVTRAVEAALRFAEIEARYGDTRAQTSDAVRRAVAAREALEAARRAVEAARSSGGFSSLPPTEAEAPALPRLQSLSVERHLDEETEGDEDASDERTRGEAFLLPPTDPEAPFPPLEDDPSGFSLPPTEPEVARMPSGDAAPAAAPAPISFADQAPVDPLPEITPAPVEVEAPADDPFVQVPARAQPSPEVTLTTVAPPPSPEVTRTPVALPLAEAEAAPDEPVPLPGREAPSEPEGASDEPAPLPGPSSFERGDTAAVPLPGLSPPSLETTQLVPLMTLPSDEVQLLEPGSLDAPPSLDEPAPADDVPRPYQHARVDIDEQVADAAARAASPWLAPEEPEEPAGDGQGEGKVLKLNDLVALMDDD